MRDGLMWLVIAFVVMVVIRAMLRKGGGARAPAMVAERSHGKEVDAALRRVQPVGREPWRADPMTDAQRRRIGSLGVAVDGRWSKGRASDVIGLFEEPDAETMEVLEFFKVRGREKMNETDARYAAAELLATRRDEFMDRPATDEQREALRFYGAKVPKGMRHAEAAREILALEDKDVERANRWDDLVALYESVSDPDAYLDGGRRKVSWRRFMAAVRDLQAEGVELDDVDEDVIVGRLYPDDAG